ncbi:MAG: metallophosphoesterase [Lentisphaeria bacterium]|nr:metallophosphoesterase [Lentisphaeria bacterium]
MKREFPTQKEIIRQERRKWSRSSLDDVLLCREERFLSGGFLFKKFVLSFDGKKERSCRGEETALRILFFSDTHIRNDFSRSFFPCLKWQGSTLIFENLEESIALAKPDILLFGGDLAGESCIYPESAALFSRLAVPEKFAIHGNWDKKGNTALSYAARRKMLEEAGVRLLVNEGVFLRKDLFLYGFDDTRMGYPLLSLPDEAANGEIIRIFAAHSPDTVTGRLQKENISLNEKDLFLCGHTHGGQIRMPLFGALRTSTYSGKKLEMAWYEHKENHAKMFVSSGIGTTFIHTRIFSPPEIVLLEIKSRQG